MAVVDKLARYRELRPLGTGGMAKVVLAQDTVLGRPVALKRVYASTDPQARARLRREALVGASLNHPNLVAVYDVIDGEAGEMVVVMEYVAGETLQERLRREGRLPVRETLRIISGVASGLDAIHSRGVVHRDVKPANVLLGSDGAVKLADLGVAAAPDRTSITTAGTVVGSFAYMAPEQLEDGPTSPRIDVYALAAVAYELLSGRRAHPEATPVAVAHSIATQPPPDLRTVWPEAPAPVAALLARAMARDPAQRPDSAGELAGRLRGALVPALTPSEPVRPRPAPAVALAAAGAPRRAPARAAARAPRRPVPPPERSLGSRWLFAGIPVALVAIAVLAVILINSGTGKPASTARIRAAVTHRAGARPAPTKPKASSARTPGAGAAAPSAGRTPAATAQTTSTTSSTTTPATSTPPATTTPANTTPPSTGAPAPEGAVLAFYENAASHQYPAAWALADPTFRNQLGGYPRFIDGQSGDRRIAFNSIQVTNQTPSGATVAITTTSMRDNGTSHCGGTVALVRAGAGGGWLLDHIDINCSPA